MKRVPFSVWAVLSMLAAAPLHADAVHTSTPTSRPMLTLQFVYGEKRQVGLDYRWRWNMRDLRALPAAIGRWERGPVRGLIDFGRNMDYGTRFNVYGLRMSGSGTFSPGAPRVAGGGPPGPGAARSLLPDMRDLTTDLHKTIRRSLISESVDLAFPGARGASYSQKETIALDLWRAGAEFGVLPERSTETAPSKAKPDGLEKSLDKIRQSPEKP